MKGGCWIRSPKRGGAAYLFCIAGLILFSISIPTASALSFPFSIPFLSSPDDGCELSLDLDQPLAEYGSSITYTIHLTNSGAEDLTDISVTDNFGQVGFIASLPEGESFDLARTTPPLKSSTRLKVVASSGGEDICRAEAAVKIGPHEEELSIPKQEDQTLKIMSSDPEIELVVGADPSAVLPGEKTTVRMIVTNRCSFPLRDVEISGPDWTVKAGDLKPGESKTYSKTLTIAEDLSAELTATGTADDGSVVTDQKSLIVSTVSSDLSVTVISNPATSGQPSTTEYRLKNEGEEALGRVTLKDGDGVVLGILPLLGPGESKSLTRTKARDQEASGQVEVTAFSQEGKTVTGEVIVQPTAAGPDTSSSRQPARSGSSKSSSGTSELMGLGAGREFEKMDMELNFDKIGSDSGFGSFDMGFDFGDFGLGRTTDRQAASADAKVEPETETGSPNLVVTLQANRTLVHKGEVVGYRCAAVNRGTASLSDVELRCGDKTATAHNLAPGDGLPLEGAIRAEGSLNLTAFSRAPGPDGSELTDEASLQIEVISPDLNIEVYKDPEDVCRGQRVSIVVRLENTGDDALSDVIVADELGDIGKIPVIRPGEARTLMRNSTIDESLEDVVTVVATDSTGRRLQRSETLSFRLLEPRLDLTVEPQDAAAYPGDVVEAVWTIRNTGEVDLVDVTFEGTGKSIFRLPAVAAGGSTPVSSTYFADESREVLGRAEGRTAGGETVSNSATFRIDVVSPGISLNVKPLEVEACPEKVFNLTCLLTNSGDNVLKDVTLSEKSLGTLENIGRLEPGDFKVVPLDFFAETNTTFHLEAKGIDTLGKTWTDSRNVAVKLVSANIELSVRADPPETAPGGTVNVICTVKNQGNVPVFSTFIMGRSLKHLGNIDYISPGSSRALEREIEVSEEIEDEITAEGFTKDGASVIDRKILLVRLTEPLPPTEEEESVSAEVPEASTGTKAEDAFGVDEREIKYQEKIGPGEKGNESEVVAIDSSGITGLIDRLKVILENIRLKKERPAEESASSGTTPVGSEPASSSAAPSSPSLPASSTQWSGYGIHEGGMNTSPSPLSSDKALPEGAGYAPSTEVSRDESALGLGEPETAGYAYSDGGPASGDLSSPEPHPEAAAYSYSAEGLASSYLSSPWISPGCAGYAYSASGPASAYLSAPWTSSGSAGYASSDSGPFSALTSPAGISPNLAGSATPTSYDNVNPRSASEASPKVAESKVSTEDSSRLICSEASPDYAGAAAPAGSLGSDSPFQSKSPSKNFKLVIGDPSSLEVDRPPKIIDVGAFPPEPTAWSPVVVAVHASDDIGIKSVDMLWDTPTTAVTKLDLVDITKINTQKMELEEGDLNEGYWSYEIPGQAPGTYMAVFIKVSDGERWAEDGPYILFWSGAASGNEAPPTPPAAQEKAEEDGGKKKTVETKKNGMLFVESTTVVGIGDVSIKNEFREDNARYKEELDGWGSIEMQSEKTINKGNPIVNITDSRLLVFDQGYLKGFKVMQSPSFHGGMGASVTERFNATTLEKSETGTISSVDRSENTLVFNTQQAFEGIWGTKTEYSNFNKKIKADQKLTGTFETQKKITFED